MIPDPASRPAATRRAWLAFGSGLPANFWKLWASSATSNLSEGITMVAFPLIAVRLTDSPAEVAGIAVAAQAPTLLLVSLRAAWRIGSTGAGRC